MSAKTPPTQARFFAGLVEQHYPLQVRALHPLAQTEEKQVWHVEGAAGEAIILRAHARPAALPALHRQAALLAALAARRFPAEQLVPTRLDEPIVAAGPWALLATAAVAGRATTHAIADLRALGARIAQLHALDPRALLGAGGAVGAAAMLPAREIAWVTGELAHIEGQLTAPRREDYGWLLRALAALDRCADLPTVLIHNDCHPGNAITTLDGATTLIDWEGAGLGPAIIDLGFLLASSVSPAPWSPPLPPDPARVAAIVAGYRRHRQPTATELDRLADAIRFRALIFGAAAFARSVAPGGAPGAGWWRARYDAAGPIARQVRALCEVGTNE